MRMSDIQPGMKVRFHPVIGGRHDGNIYTVTPAGAVELPGAGQVCWLAEKCGCVAIAALSPVCGNAELQQMDLSGEAA